MGIRSFIGVFFLVSIFFVFYGFDNSTLEIRKNNNPLISFADASLYNINENSLQTIVNAKKVDKYEDRDEFIETTAVYKNKGKSSIIDSIYANKMIYADKKLLCKGNVRFNRNSVITLQTSELSYNTLTKVLSTQNNFVAKYYDNYLSGNALFVDNNAKLIKVAFPHFEIEVRK